jgi:diguanylate cyclase (GGDEF)-like protein/PAS domain S-box-containing protein
MKDSGLIKANILVVEDESIVALDIKQRLEVMGYKVVAIVNSGEQAIQKSERLNPDLVLMDVKLKGKMDGIEAAAIIRANLHLPIIFLTAFADESSLHRASVTESFGYILKPFEERELSINIEMALYKHKMENQLRESEERYSLAARGVNDGLWDWNLKTGVVYYSPRWKEMLDFHENEIGTDIEEWRRLIHPEDRDRFELDLANHLAGLTPHFKNESRLSTSKNELRWMLTRGVAVYNQEGVPYRMAGSQSDVTERKLAEQQLLHDAFHDALTNLPNRTLFLDRLERTMERKRRNDQVAYSVLFLDLDRFKVINDSLGHQQGDRLLVEFAERTSHILRSSDTLARLGGDEFVILLEELKDSAETERIAERILDDLKLPFQLNDQPVFITASIGIVAGSSDYLRPEDILRDADIAMYRAKADGKARHALFDPVMRERAVTRLELEGDLRLALSRGEFSVFYQPILSLETGRVTGFEALLRWFHPVRGSIPPMEFIAVAEEIGLIMPIGRWVLSKACHQLRQWQLQFPYNPSLTMSVNISGRQLSHPAFLEQVQQILQEANFDPQTLKLEITESLLMVNSEDILSTLKRLREMGIQLLIDDFGTGFSNLGYVPQFPINTIKIDKLFVNQMGANGKNSEIAHTIVQLANDWGFGTIAEGIETSEQLDQLKSMDCESGQGWLFSKAVSSDQIEAYLKAFEKHAP